MNTCSLNIRNFPAEVRAQFKANCAKHDLTMTGVIVGVLTRLAHPVTFEKFVTEAGIKEKKSEE